MLFEADEIYDTSIINPPINLGTGPGVDTPLAIRYMHPKNYAS